MSKSLGTGIDPLDVIAAHGADATRYGLLKMSSTQDVRFSYGAVEEGWRLANKLWNVARLVLTNAGDARPDARPVLVEDRWILARLDAATGTVERAFAEFDFAEAVRALYHVTFDDFCDWYAELVKPRLYERDPDATATALAALEHLLCILHPVMPHVTEEIWGHLPARAGRLIVAAWPARRLRVDADLHALDGVQEAVRVHRRTGVAPPRFASEEERRIFEVMRAREDGRPQVELGREIERLRKEVARAEGMLANERFVANAPPDVVEGERTKLERYRRELAALEG
jgi:valyl-tRNA synthetase